MQPRVFRRDSGFVQPIHCVQQIVLHLGIVGFTSRPRLASTSVGDSRQAIFNIRGDIPASAQSTACKSVARSSGATRQIRRLLSALLFLGTISTLSIDGRAAAENRPLVTLLTQLPGPMAPQDKQWVPQSISVNAKIPDSRRMTSDITTTDVYDGACGQLYGIRLDVSLTHQRAADLIVDLSTVSRDGGTILKTKTIFNGLQLASGKSAPETDKITFPTAPFVDLNSLLESNDCARWRLTVSDVALGNIGTLLSWTLSRRVAWFPYTHDRLYYEGLLFGGGGMTPNVVDYYREVSRGKFAFANAGIYGPVVWKNWLNNWISCADSAKPHCEDEKHIADVIHLLEDAGFDFQRLDKNQDNVISREELAIVAIANNDEPGATRSGPDPSGCTTLNRSPLRVCAQVVLIREQMDFETLAHELSHQALGTVDLYAEDYACFSYGLTLMSCTIGPSDSKTTVYLDPWHRMKSGWLFPNDLGFGNYELGDEAWTNVWGDQSQPAFVRNPSNAHEFFLFEYRCGRGYDRNVADCGLVVWHVKEDENGNAFKGVDGKETEGHAIYVVSPDNDRGGTRAWNAGDGKFQLRWSDGTPLPRSFWVEAPRQQSASSVVLNWRPAPADNQPPAIEIVRPADKSSGPLGFGNPTVFEARVTDPEDGGRGLRIDWRSDVDGLLGTESLIEYPFATPGDRIITITARDRFGATRKASIKYTVDNVLPSASIFTPMQNATYFRKIPVFLSGTGRTPVLFALPCDRLTWTIDRTPSWSASGCTVVQAFDFIGTATFTLTARDDYNQVGTATASVNFADPSPTAPPFVMITSPVGGSLIVSKSERFRGVVTDPSAGPVTYRWTVFDTRTLVETEIATVANFDWAPGMQLEGRSIEIRLYGTNSAGVNTVRTVNLFVQPLPR
jgi:M6 family metalloprotease-like protein